MITRVHRDIEHVTVKRAIIILSILFLKHVQILKGNNFILYIYIVYLSIGTVKVFHHRFQSGKVQYENSQVGI